MSKRNSKKNKQKQNSDNIVNQVEQNQVQNDVTEASVNNETTHGSNEEAVVENNKASDITDTIKENVVDDKKEADCPADKNNSEEKLSEKENISNEDSEKDIHLIEAENLYHVVGDEKDHVIHNPDKKKTADINSVYKIATFVFAIGIVVLAVMFKQSLADTTEANRMVDTLNEQIKIMTGDYDSLKKEYDEINEKNKLLSDSLNAKSAEIGALETEKADMHIPFSYPLKGSAAIKNDEIEMEDQLIEGNNEENPDVEADNAEEVSNDIVYFVCDSGTRVIATGSGVVESITKQDASQEVTGHLDFMGNFIFDQTYDTYEIVIDHENGYKTKYTASGALVIDEGDTVSKGSVILFIEKPNSVFGYQVEFENEYIDPLSCMEING